MSERSSRGLEEGCATDLEDTQGLRTFAFTLA